MLLLASSLASLAITTCTTALQCPLQTGCFEELGSSGSVGEDAALGYDVNPGTGNLHLAHQDIVARPPLGPVLEFTRYYNSQANGIDVGMGANWTHTFAWSISVSGGGVAQLMGGDGHWIYFEPIVGGGWTSPNGEFGTLTGTMAAGFTYTNKTGTAYAFDTSGRLTSITPADNTAITINYSGATTQITTVTSGATGTITMTLTFAYTAGHITSIGDGTNTWSYGYTGTTPVVLSTVTFPNVDTFSNHGMRSYTYTAVTPVTGTTFSPGTGLTAQITEIQTLESAGAGGTSPVWVPVAFFGYTTPVAGSNQVTKAAGGFDAINLILIRYTTFSYSLCYDAASTSTTTVTVAGGTKTVTSKEFAAGAAGLGEVQRLTSISSTAGSGAAGELPSESISWNTTLTVASFTNGNGHVRTFTNYDAEGNPKTITEASDTASPRTTTLTYHSVLSLPLTMTRASVDGISGHNHTITWNYGGTNYLNSIVETGYSDAALAGGVGTLQTYTTTINYNANHTISEIDGPLPSAKTTYAYFATGPYTNYLNTTTTYSSATASLTQTIVSYDGEGRITKTTEPNGTSKTYTYDPVGALTELDVTATGQPTLTDTYTHDLAEDLLTHTTPEGTSVVNEYDSVLRVWRQHALSGTYTPWSRAVNFDAFNRPISTRGYSGTSGAAGAAMCGAGSEQFCEEMSYDAYHRLSYFRTLDSTNTACTGNNCETVFSYDGNNNIASRVEEVTPSASSNTYTFNRDAFDRVTKVILPTSKYSTVTYDINDRLITRHDPKDSANGGSGGSRLTTYLNDDFGRMVKVVNPDIGTWITDYDALGHMTSSKDASGTSLTYSYDYMGRRTGITSSVANDSVTYAYDQTGTIATGYSYGSGLGRLTSILAKDSSGNLINTYYSYDYVGRQLADVEGRGAAGALTYAASQYTWNKNGEANTVTYPDGLMSTYRYPTSNGFAPRPLPNEIDVPFSGTSIPVVSSVTRFADGMVSGLTYGSGSARAIQRNKRGEVTSVVSGTGANPWVNEQLSYDSSGLGELTEVSFNPSLGNAWQWTFGYDSLRRLTSYTTTARAATSGNDAYSWNYDEVGNRTSEIYNSATTNYTYDTGNTTSQLQSLSGSNPRSWTYDSNGDVAQDHTTGVSGTWNQYAYSTRHHLARLDYYSGSTFQYTLENYQNDGRDRRWQKSSPNGARPFIQFYYDHKGRVLEEYQQNGNIVNGCAAYDIIDHVYLASGANEVARIKRSFQSGAGCGSYNMVDKDIFYVHEDYRRTAFALESKSTGLLVWEAETSPYGIVAHEGLPGADGIIGTPDDGAYTDKATDNNLGMGEQYRDQESSNLASGPGSNASITQTNRTLQANADAVRDILGTSIYASNLITVAAANGGSYGDGLVDGVRSGLWAGVEGGASGLMGSRTIGFGGANPGGIAGMRIPISGQQESSDGQDDFSTALDCSKAASEFWECAKTEGTACDAEQFVQDFAQCVGDVSKQTLDYSTEQSEGEGSNLTCDARHPERGIPDDEHGSAGAAPPPIVQRAMNHGKLSSYSILHEHGFGDTDKGGILFSPTPTHGPMSGRRLTGDFDDATHAPAPLDPDAFTRSFTDPPRELFYKELQ